jgi:hypothetical protein
VVSKRMRQRPMIDLVCRFSEGRLRAANAQNWAFEPIAAS